MPTRILIRALVFLLLLLIFTAGIHIALNSPTSHGDGLRHRPLWRWIADPLLESQLSSIKLGDLNFLYGDESQTAKLGLKALTKSFDEDAQLNGMGKLMAIGVLGDLLSQAKCVRDHTSTLKSVILHEDDFGSNAPIIIVGLPRTGTSFLHAILAVDEVNWRAPRFHEYLDGCPTPSIPGASFWDEIKLLVSEARLWFTRILVPSISEKHPIEVTSPEEDTIPLAHEIHSVLFPTAFFTPTYNDFLRSPGWEKRALEAVKHVKSLLEVHLRQLRRDSNNHRPWLLKSPQHLFQLEVLVNVFPNARIVWLHRDVGEAISSTASVVCTLVGGTTDALKNGAFIRKVANNTAEFWLWAFLQGLEQRKRLELQERNRFIDVKFTSLTKDPLGEVRRIYSELGLSLSQENEMEMIKFINKWQASGATGKHRHSLARFGLDRRDILERVGDLNQTDHL